MIEEEEVGITKMEDPNKLLRCKIIGISTGIKKHNKELNGLLVIDENGNSYLVKSRWHLTRASMSVQINIEV